MLNDIYRDLVFFAGDIRRERCPLGFAWGRQERLIDYEEMEQAKKFAQIGYIGLHRNIGDLSNVAIKGFFKHAWMFGGNNNIIEAVSEGVLPRHMFHPLSTDYAVILKPTVFYPARSEAWNRLRHLAALKVPYDHNFKFDLEIEESLFSDKETAFENMREYRLGVSCTELVALGYVGYRRELGLYRTALGKRQVILPDAFMSTHFEVVWASKFTTPEIAKSYGMGEEGVEALKKYWREKRC